jgi:hypothetical protein
VEAMGRLDTWTSPAEAGKSICAEAFSVSLTKT